MAKTAKKSVKKAAKKSPAKAPKKAAPKKAAKKTASKGAAKKSGRKPNAAFMAPLTVSSELAEIIGDKPMPRTEITKKMWDYIKKNNLQDKKNRRMINADDKLKIVFGGKNQVSMFELPKMVNSHVKK
jgi:chromatin remodeling complex protein RSC6